MATPSSTSPSTIPSLLAQAGLRNTAATRHVLALFERDDTHLLTHAEIGERLRQQDVLVDKVTLYRLLDRLVHAGLLDKRVDDDRLFRYGWAQDAVSAPSATPVHPRFECRACHQRYRLTELPKALSAAIQQAMGQWGRQGFQGQEADLAVRGVCAQCVAH